MSTKEKKHELLLTIFWCAAVILLIVKILLPETGILGMVNVGSTAILFFGIGGNCIWSIFCNKKKKKSTFILKTLIIPILALSIGGYISKNLVLDLISGPKIVNLVSVTTEESFGIFGTISFHHYLCGRDEENWTKYRFDISADEYYELEGEQQVTVLCYPRTERILKFL